MKGHYGWRWIPNEDIRFLNEKLNLSLPISVKQLGDILPEYQNFVADTEHIEYHYTLNPVKDDLLKNSNSYGMTFDREGNLKFEY